jgi:putative hydroxymethylpyrimidine transport system substrate-binding protein
MVKVIRCIAAALAAAALLVGCGAGSGTSADRTTTAKEEPLFPAEPRWSFRLTLDSRPSPENVGILMAVERGFFADEGIGFLMSTPATTGRPIRYLMEGLADVSISHEPQVVLAQAKGLPIVAFGSLIPRSTMAMIWLEKSGIDDVSDLAGKTIAIPEVPIQESFLEIVLARAGLTLADVKLERVPHELVPELVSGRADAVFGGSGSLEGAELESRGLEATITPVTKLGIPPYEELVLVARRDWVAENPELVRHFRAAVARGTAAAIENPKAATETILKTPGGEPSRKATEAGVEATLPLLSKTAETSPGEADEKLVEWMRAQGLIQRRVFSYRTTE